MQATFSDYAPQLKLGTTNNYSLYKEGTNSRMSSNDYMDLYLKVDYPFLIMEEEKLILKYQFFNGNISIRIWLLR